MSNVEKKTAPSNSSDCPPPPGRPAVQRIATRDAVLGESMTIRRALPTKSRRMVGAWCFLDHFGPVDVTRGTGLRVGPHPHIGLQTVTWMLEGEILHRDSLGCVQPIRAGQLNLMTAGRGISHSEESPDERPPRLHGVQLWIALPEAARHCEPAFHHHPALPVVEREGVTITVLLGEAFGQRSPGKAYSPLVGLDLALAPSSSAKLPLEERFEYGAIVTEGEASFDGERLAPGTFLYLGSGRQGLDVRSSAAARAVIVGGEPFGEDILLWWNFVGRSKADIEQAVADWVAQRRFGDFSGYPGERLAAPPVPWSG